MKNYIGKKKEKSFYGKRITAVLLLYLLFIFLCSVTTGAVVLSLPDEQTDAVGAICLFVALFIILAGSAVVIFFIIPYLKRKQAGIDFSRHDFTPYARSDGNEIFRCENHAYTYVLTSSPFGQDGESEKYLPDITAFNKYIEQFLPDRLISERPHEANGGYPDFYIKYYSEGYDGISARVVKKIDGERTALDIYDIYTAEFTDDGIKVGEKFYPYSLIDADVVTGFGHNTEYSVIIRIILGIADEGYLSFAFSSRIVGVVKKYGVRFYDRKLFDYIAADPKRAFEQTALQLGLRKLK